MPDWPGPADGERPSAYIVILGERQITASFDCDHGIAAQTILLAAVERGLGGCIIGSVQREALRGVLAIPAHHEILLLLALGTPAELARQVGRSQRLEIEVAPEGVSTALEVLQESPGVKEIDHEEGHLWLTGVSRESIPDLVAALVAAGVRVYRLTPQEPSLEDVYFALQGDEGGE